MCREQGDWRRWSAALGELGGGVRCGGGWEGNVVLGCWLEAWEGMGVLCRGIKVSEGYGSGYGGWDGVLQGVGCHRVLCGCCRCPGGAAGGRGAMAAVTMI